MKRYLVTLVVVLCMAGAYRVYSAIISPFTVVEAAPMLEAVSERTDVGVPKVFAELAENNFPDAEWTQQAKHTWQISESIYLYFQDSQPEPGMGNVIKFTPVAILWTDPKAPEAKPYRILAESARLQFENEFFDQTFDLSSVNPGRLRGASLDGPVRIDGPNGLTIEGQSFKFREEGAELYSDYPIAFRYGPTPDDTTRFAGTADQLRLTFFPSSESLLGEDMPRVGGLATILLRRNVDLQVAYDKDGMQNRGRITSAGQFSYDVNAREASFEDNVKAILVEDIRDGQLADSIECQRMILKFQQPTVADDGKPDFKRPFENLVFQQMRARSSGGPLNSVSSRVKIASDKRGIQASMQDLMYNAITRQARLEDPQQVEVTRGTTTFRSPKIHIQHGPENELEQLHCQGKGELLFSNPQLGTHPAHVAWEGGVEVLPEPDSDLHRIQILHQTELNVPERVALVADMLTLWTRLDQLQSMNEAEDKNPQKSSPIADNQLFPIDRVQAAGDVRMASNQLQIRRAGQIDAVIRHGRLSESSSINEHLSDSGGGSETADQSSSPWIAEADRFTLDLLVAPGAEPTDLQIDIQRATANGSIRIETESSSLGDQSNGESDGPVVITGESLIAENEGGLKQTVHLRGTFDEHGEIAKQAGVAVGKTELWGGDLSLVREENRVDIRGPGGLSMPVQADLGGEPTATEKQTAKDVLLDLVWREGMAFDGQIAQFWGQVTASLPNTQDTVSRLGCEHLTARFNHLISFQDPERGLEEIDIQQVAAKNHVMVEAFEYDGRELVSVRRIQNLAEFGLNRATGDFSGYGHGEIHNWSSGDQMRLSPDDAAEANRPANRPAAKWRYTNVKFRKIHGNMNHQEATLSESVEILTAPVANKGIKFARENLSDSTPEAEHAVCLECEDLHIALVDSPERERPFVELTATGGPRLEGHIFSAVADELTFEERGEKFRLRGHGKNATLFLQEKPGTPVSPFEARSILFVPREGRYNFEGARGTSGGL